jgi:hypothetical protein
MAVDLAWDMGEMALDLAHYRAGQGAARDETKEIKRKIKRKTSQFYLQGGSILTRVPLSSGFSMSRPKNSGLIFFTCREDYNHAWPSGKILDGSFETYIL